MLGCDVSFDSSFIDRESGVGVFKGGEQIAFFDRLTFGDCNLIEDSRLLRRNLNLLDQREHDRVELQATIGAWLGDRIVTANRAGDRQAEHQNKYCAESNHEIVSRPPEFKKKQS